VLRRIARGPVEQTDRVQLFIGEKTVKTTISRVLM
jgi:hypothetical protein